MESETIETRRTSRPGGRRAWWRTAFLQKLGPGLVTGAADDDPSGIATYSQAGAQFGFNMLWTMLLTFPLMAAIQLISAQIGRVTGCGLAKNMLKVLPRPVVFLLVMSVFLANSINIGADVVAMATVTQVMLGGSKHIYAIVYTGIPLFMLLFTTYERYASYLKWLTFALFSYIAVVFVVHIDWAQVALGFVAPRFALDGSSFTLIVAVFGTTISPYLFFWQSSQEVEELDQHPGEKPLKDAPLQAPRQMERMRIDTFVGMGISNIVGAAVIISTAATLYAQGHHDIASAVDAAQALRPIAGDFAFALFGLGIVGTGLLSVPILAGSAGYALGECMGWTCGLERKPWEAVGFYGVMAAAAILGLGVEFAGIDAMKALFWSAVINGYAAVPVMAVMMWIAGRTAQMDIFAVAPVWRTLGWVATAIMTVAAIAMLVV